jgi:hypothetical protein
MFSSNFFRIVFLSFPLLTLTLGCNENKEQVATSVSGMTFDDFRYPERYATIVESAEAGNVQAIKMLALYYSSLPKTDLRNLEYWSGKLAKIEGSGAFSNLILSFARHNKCDRAWEVLGKNYLNFADYPFFQVKGSMEFIDGKCGRKTLIPVTPRN